MSHDRSLDPTLGRKSLVRMSKLITSDLVLLVLLTACNYSGGATPNYDASGIPVAPQEGWTLGDGRVADSFVLTGADGTLSYAFITTAGDKYLTISGEGNLALVAELAPTVRPILPGN